MIRNKRQKRVGVPNALFAWLGSPGKSAKVIMPEGRFTRRPSHEINAIRGKVLAFTANHGLIAAGVAAAIASAAFATLMISKNSHPDIVQTSEYSGVFARALRARSHQSQVHASITDGQAVDYRTIDYNVTGSISMSGVGKSAQSAAAASNVDGRGASSGARNENTYVLRFVHKNAALLQSDNGYIVARRGTLLSGAGKVLSIEKLGDHWILLTTTQIFGNQE